MAGQKDKVLQLLKDYATWRAAFGGAFPLDESAGVSEANYGPAGLIFTGMAFSKADRERLAFSYGKLNAALRLLWRDHTLLWASLVEPYLSDTADPSIIGHWREKIAELDKENRIRAKSKKPPKVALTVPRMLLERHDKAIVKLSEYLKGVDLHYVPAHAMSQEEKEAGDDFEARIYATYQRHRVAKNRHDKAVEMTAYEFGVPTDKVERVIEFRRDISEDECSEAGCDRAPYANGMCQKHNMREWRRMRGGAA